MAKTEPKSVTAFSTGDVDVPKRPTTTITIGSGTYDVRAPKMSIWMDTGFMLERIDKGQAARERLENEAVPLVEQRDLQQLVDRTPEPEEIHALLIDGRIENGRITGGFLRRCLGPDGYARVANELDDDDTELDMPDLYQAAFELYQEFEPWCVARAETMGLVAPKASPGRKRAASTGAGGGAKRAGSR